MSSDAKADRSGSRVISFGQHETVPEASRPAADRIISGDPQQLTWNHYSDPTGQFHAGIWQGEVGAWRVQYGAREEELCTIIEGRVRLIDEQGRAQEFSPGATFVVPGGFRGIWENLSRVRKVYAVGTLQAGGVARPQLPQQGQE